jgi:hypothetical protein
VGLDTRKESGFGHGEKRPALDMEKEYVWTRKKRVGSSTERRGWFGYEDRVGLDVEKKAGFGHGERVGLDVEKELVWTQKELVWTRRKSGCGYGEKS